MKTIEALGILTGLYERGAISMPPFILEDGADACVEYSVAIVKLSGRLDSIATQQELVDSIDPALSDLVSRDTTHEEILKVMQSVVDELEQFGNSMPSQN